MGAGSSTGLFVVVVGPDGVGKTTLAREVLERWNGPKGYFHFLPTRHSPVTPTPDGDRLTPPPKAPRTGSRLLGWLRLGRNLIRFWIAYVVHVRPLIRDGALVIGDRWWYGYIGQPFSLRFYGPQELAIRSEPLFPKPDLVIDLKAPTEVIASRKPELTSSEIRDELTRWSLVAKGRRLEVDATKEASLLAEATVAIIEGWHP